jgi:hypothetical protein
VTGLKTQLQFVESSLLLVGKRSLDESLLKKCLGDIERLRDEANLVLLEIDRFVQKIQRTRPSPNGATSTLSKRKWMRRKHTMFHMTAKVTPIVHSLTVVASELRAIASEQTLDRLDSMLTSFSIQNIDFAGPSSTKPDTGDDSTFFDKRLESVIRQASLTEDGTTLPSRRSSIDSFHSAISNSSDSVCSVVSLSGTLVDNTCEAFCPCQCHITSQSRTPQWIRHILGSMTFHGNASVSLSKRPCNKTCRRSGPATVQFTYFAPSWTLLRAFNFACLESSQTMR